MIGHYIHKRIRQVRKYWKRYITKQQGEDLHQMRVEIKKLAAMLRFVKSEQPDYRLKHSLNFIRNTFKLSGAIRDADNTLLLARKFHVSSLEATGPDNVFPELKKRFNRNNKLQKIEKYTHKYIQPIGVKQLEKYVHLQLSEMIGLIAKGIKKDTLHNLRKKLKDIYYLDKILQKRGKGLANGTAALLDELQDKIGKWHDIELFEQEIRTLKPKPVKSLKQIVDSEKKLLIEIDKLFRSVV